MVDPTPLPVIRIERPDPRDEEIRRLREIAIETRLLAIQYCLKGHTEELSDKIKALGPVIQPL